MTDAPEWVAVVNRHAGTKSRDLTDLESAARVAGAVVDFRSTESADEVPDVVRSAVASGVKRFVAVGGDGTVHVLVNALMSVQTQSESPVADDRFAVAVVPSGSGSDLTRTFGHTADLAAAFARIATPELYAVDIGRITLGDGTVRFFVNVADIGVAAAAVRTATRLPRWIGRTKYTVAFWLALSTSKVPQVDLRVDRHRFEGKAINIVVANGQFFGGGMNIAPRASMSDGTFDVQVFTGRKRQAFSVMPRVLTGSHLTHNAVRRFVGGSVIVSGPPDLELESDGELIGSGPVAIDLMPKAIDLVI